MTDRKPIREINFSNCNHSITRHLGQKFLEMFPDYDVLAWNKDDKWDCIHVAHWRHAGKQRFNRHVYLYIDETMSLNESDELTNQVIAHFQED